MKKITTTLLAVFISIVSMSQSKKPPLPLNSNFKMIKIHDNGFNSDVNKSAWLSYANGELVLTIEKSVYYFTSVTPSNLMSFEDDNSALLNMQLTKVDDDTFSLKNKSWTIYFTILRK